MCGQYDIPLCLPAIKIFARVHNCEDLWRFFLTKLQNDDKKIAIFTSQVFKDFSLQYPDFVEKSYLPALLNLAEKEQYVLERLESI